jgi:hypothetical protein
MTHSTDHPAPMSSPVYPPGRGAGDAWTHAGLVVAGTAAAGVIYAASWAVVGPWDFARERPPGPPPGAMEKGPPPDGA